MQSIPARSILARNTPVWNAKPCQGGSKALTTHPEGSQTLPEPNPVLCPRFTGQGGAGPAQARLSCGTRAAPAPGTARAVSPLWDTDLPWTQSRCWGRGAGPWGQRNCTGGSPSDHFFKPHSSPQAGKSLFTELPKHPELQRHLLGEHLDKFMEKPGCFEPVSQICADLKD